MTFKAIFIKQEVLSFIRNEVESMNNEVETGGILMGYYTISNEVVITHCCGPGPKAIQKKYSIILDSTYAQQFVNNIYYETEGKISYIGDWHSHTSNDLTPSYIDKREISKISTNKKSRLKIPLMMITNYEENLFNKVFYFERKQLHELCNIYILE